MRALVIAHRRKRFVGDGAHAFQVEIELEIEHGAHMQTALRGMRIERAVRAVARKNIVESRGIVGKMLEGHRAIFDE